VQRRSGGFEYENMDKEDNRHFVRRGFGVRRDFAFVQKDAGKRKRGHGFCGNENDVSDPRRFFKDDSSDAGCVPLDQRYAASFGRGNRRDGNEDGAVESARRFTVFLFRLAEPGRRKRAAV